MFGNQVPGPSSHLSRLESVVLDVAVAFVSARHSGRGQVAALDDTKCREDGPDILVRQVLQVVLSEREERQ